jgi:hypothetical protein
MTPMFLPFSTSARRGDLHAGLGFSGHGLASTKLGGKILSSLALGVDDQWGRMPAVGPPRALVPPPLPRWPLIKSVAWARQTGHEAMARGGRRGLVRSVVDRRYGACCERALGAALRPT